jgi:hypothetical protein
VAPCRREAQHVQELLSFCRRFEIGHVRGISSSSELTKAEYAGKLGSSDTSIQGFGRRLYVWIDGKQGCDTSSVHGALDRIGRKSHDQGAGCLLELPGGRQNDP